MHRSVLSHIVYILDHNVLFIVFSKPNKAPPSRVMRCGSTMRHVDNTNECERKPEITPAVHLSLFGCERNQIWVFSVVSGFSWIENGKK